MARGRKPRTWVKLDCEGILRGSINYLLPLEGQAVWVKMIALSETCGGRPGFIEDNNEKGLPLEYVAQELHCPLEVLQDVLEKMGKDGAINVNGTGSIELVNFKHYQFSEYDRQKPYRQKQKESSKEKKTLLEHSILEHNTLLGMSSTKVQQKLNKSSIHIPDYVDKTLWDNFLEMRRRLRKPATLKAQELLMKDLDRLKAEGYAANEVLEQSIKNSYQGLFPLKGGQNGAGRQNVKQGIPGNRPSGAFDGLDEN